MPVEINFLTLSLYRTHDHGGSVFRITLVFTSPRSHGATRDETQSKNGRDVLLRELRHVENEQHLDGGLYEGGGMTAGEGGGGSGVSWIMLFVVMAFPEEIHPQEMRP